jgi:hypothetical protein
MLRKSLVLRNGAGKGKRILIGITDPYNQNLATFYSHSALRPSSPDNMRRRRSLRSSAGAVHSDMSCNDGH